jgi:hypothetical protein
MISADYPDELKFSHWDKKKGSLAPASELAGLLKALQKRHDAVDWKLFDAGWAKVPKTAADLQEAFAQRDRLARSSLFPLKKDANEIAAAAARVAKDKAAGKPALDAGKAIAAAAKACAVGVDELVDELKTLHDKALGALPAEESDDDEPSSVLLDTKQLLRCLTGCRRDPARRVQFAYVDGKDKQPAVLAMSPRMSARKVFSKLQNETGVKTGAYGTAWVDDKSLMLKVDKPLGGLVKKVRAPLRAAGFRIAKVVLWRDDGTLFEQDEDADEAAAAAAEAAISNSDATESTTEPNAAVPEAPAAGPAGDAEATFTARLKAVLAALATASAAAAGPARLLVSEAGTLARKRDWAGAATALQRAESLLSDTQVAAPAAAPTPAAPGRFVHQAKVRLGWQMARQKLAADLKALEGAILEHYRDQPEGADLATRVRRFDDVLGTLDESLADKLDAALNAADPAQRSALHEQARTILAGYAQYVRDEPLIAALDDNPFVPLSTHKTLLKTLKVLDSSLA